jgi:large subunit ribosomal protein L24
MSSKKNIVYADNFTAQRKMEIKKGDTVLVIAGKDKGKRGAVLEVKPRENRVLVENLNMVVKHKKPRQQKVGQHQEGRYEMPAPLDRSNVMLCNPNHILTQGVDKGQPAAAKIGHKLVEGKWLRYDRKTGDLL